MLDNNNTLTISSTLTKIGKKRLTEGKFKISKVAVGDDGINYSLIDQNLSDDDILIKRTPLFDVWKDGQMGIKNKIRMKGSKLIPNNRKMDYSISRVSDVMVTIGGDDRKFPEDNREEGNTILTYYGKNGNDLSNISEVKISFNHNNIFGNNAPERFITATIYDSSYFDIAVSPENMSKYTNNDLEIPKHISDDTDHNDRVTNFLENELSLGRPVFNGSVLDRNFNTAYFIGDDDQNIPKTINVLSSEEGTNRNSFVLHYKGNFNYKNAGVENYKTILELFDEISGITEYIQLSIVPTIE